MEPVCPECGDTEFEIDVKQTAVVDFSDPDEPETLDVSGDVEFDETTLATCRSCSHSAKLGEMVAHE